MKHIIITIAMIIATMGLVQGQDRTTTANYTREGNVFVQGAKRSSSRTSKDRPTECKWRDKDGNEYAVFLHTYERGEKAGRTTCYVVRTSKKTGKEYKYYLPDGEAIALEIMDAEKAQRK